MASDTKIEWADDTIDVVWGSIHWGPGAPRYSLIPKAIAELEEVARRSDKEGRPRRVFIASMADVFEDRDDLVEPRKLLWEALHRLCGRCPFCRGPENAGEPGCTSCENTGLVGPPRITPLILTKRPDVMAAWAAEHGWPVGAWAGTTVEDQQRAEERIPHLLKVPAEVRFLSCEPLLGPVDVSHWLNIPAPGLFDDDPHAKHLVSEAMREGLADARRAIDWVIAGGESGPNARPSHPAWFRSLRDQCQDAIVPFFFKQWGAWGPTPEGVPLEAALYCERVGNVTMMRRGKKAAGALLDGREWREVPDGK